MEMVKIHFGCQKPKEIEYRSQPDGFAEVWIYRDIHAEVDSDGNTDFVADGVMIRTKLSESEVEAQKKSYFKEPSEDVTVADLVEAIDILASIVLREE